MANAEQKLNKELSEAYESFERTLTRKNRRVTRAIEQSRLSIEDILGNYANGDGTIPQGKVNAVISDLDTIEGEIYRNMRDELRSEVEASARYSSESVIGAVVAVLGIATVVQFAELDAGITALRVAQEEALFGALIGSSIAEFTARIVESVFNRKGSDGLQLNDRLRELAKSLNEEIKVTLRESIRNGEVTSDILRKIKRKFKDLDWRADTLTETESLYGFRQSLARFAEDSGMVDALRIVDYPHGDPAEHRKHKCYIYANQNPHGLGQGVYPVSIRKIRNPHPRCRSTLHFVMAEELK